MSLFAILIGAFQFEALAARSGMRLRPSIPLLLDDARGSRDARVAARRSARKHRMLMIFLRRHVDIDDDASRSHASPHARGAHYCETIFSDSATPRSAHAHHRDLYHASLISARAARFTMSNTRAFTHLRPVNFTARARFEEIVADFRMAMSMRRLK